MSEIRTERSSENVSSNEKSRLQFASFQWKTRRKRTFQIQLQHDTPASFDVPTLSDLFGARTMPGIDSVVALTRPAFRIAWPLTLPFRISPVVSLIVSDCHGPLSNSHSICRQRRPVCAMDHGGLLTTAD